MMSKKSPRSILSRFRFFRELWGLRWTTGPRRHILEDTNLWLGSTSLLWVGLIGISRILDCHHYCGFMCVQTDTPGYEVWYSALSGLVKMYPLNDIGDHWIVRPVVGGMKMFGRSLIIYSWFLTAKNQKPLRTSLFAVYFNLVGAYGWYPRSQFPHSRVFWHPQTETSFFLGIVCWDLMY